MKCVLSVHPVLNAPESAYDVAQEHLDLVEIQDSHTESDTSSPLALCSCHYQQLYRALRFPLPCAACSSQPWYGGDYTRRCPNPVKITAYLQETVDFDGVISADSKVCPREHFGHHCH